MRLVSFGSSWDATLIASFGSAGVGWLIYNDYHSFAILSFFAAVSIGDGCAWDYVLLRMDHLDLSIDALEQLARLGLGLLVLYSFFEKLS